MFHPPIDSAFPKASYILKLGYIKFYNVLYRPFLLLLLLIFIGMMIIIKNIRYKIILYTSIPIICYYTILHTLIAGWNNEFIRFRTSIEYILFFIIGNDFFHYKVKKIMRILPSSPEAPNTVKTKAWGMFLRPKS